MYVARFSYDVLPVNRQQALDFIRRELQAAQQSGLTARILVPLTRGQGGGAALQFEVELANLDQLDQFRNRGVGSSEDTGHWMHDFSKILTAPPCVEILRAEDQRWVADHGASSADDVLDAVTRALEQGQAHRRRNSGSQSRFLP
jgi:hypothetical protein